MCFKQFRISPPKHSNSAGNHQSPLWIHSHETVERPRYYQFADFIFNSLQIKTKNEMRKKRKNEWTEWQMQPKQLRVTVRLLLTRFLPDVQNRVSFQCQQTLPYHTTSLSIISANSLTLAPNDVTCGSRTQTHSFLSILHQLILFQLWILHQRVSCSFF